MRILCVTNGLGSGGAQRQLVELAIGFKAKGHEVSFLTYMNTSFFIPVLEKEGISVNCIDEPRYWPRLIRMRRIIRSGNFDAVLSFLEAACFISEIAGLPWRRWKLVVGERSANPAISRSPGLIMYRWFHLLANHVVANSHANMDLVKKANPLLPRRKTHVIYNINDFGKWAPRRQHKPREGVTRLIVVASHQYLKNLNGLVEALNLLSPEERKHIAVDWYGERLKEPFIDSSIAEGREKISRYGLQNNITLYPAINPIAPKIQEADALGLFSFYEGFPNTVCEGMACAKPILCSRVSDLKDILAHEGDLLFDPSDPASICSALINLIRKDEQELNLIGERNSEIARALFDREINTEKYLTLLGA